MLYRSFLHICGLTVSHPTPTAEVLMSYCCAFTAETVAIWPKQELRKLVLIQPPIFELVCTEPDCYCAWSYF